MLERTDWGELLETEKPYYSGTKALTGTIWVIIRNTLFIQAVEVFPALLRCS
jgi:hypothetical protein